MRLTKYHLIEALIIVNRRYDNCIEGTERLNTNNLILFLSNAFSGAIKNDISFIHSTRLGVFIY